MLHHPQGNLSQVIELKRIKSGAAGVQSSLAASIKIKSRT
jgi:hypothetical protein